MRQWYGTREALQLLGRPLRTPAWRQVSPHGGSTNTRKPFSHEKPKPRGWDATWRGEDQRTSRASLVAQWLRICLLMQGTRVQALVREDPTCRRATRPVSHNYWACTSGACAPQQDRLRQWEARAPRWRVAPTCHNWRKPSHRNEDPTQPKK